MATEMRPQIGVHNSTVRQPVVALPRMVGVDKGQDATKTVAEQAAGAQQQEVSLQELRGAVSEIAGHFQNVMRNLSFNIDEDTGKTVVKVIDAESQEVIRQFPSEEVLALARHLRELSDDKRGVLIQSKA